MQLWVQRLAGKKWPLDVPDGVEVLLCCARHCAFERSLRT